MFRRYLLSYPHSLSLATVAFFLFLEHTRHFSYLRAFAQAVPSACRAFPQYLHCASRTTSKSLLKHHLFNVSP